MTAHIKRPPDAPGQFGRKAWRLPLDKLVKDKEPTATLASWLVFCPGAHPLWSYWGTSIIHLRPMPGCDDAVISTPGATHELMVCTVNPDLSPLPDPDGAAFAIMEPFDLTHQLILKNDAQAVAIMERYIERVVTTGHVSPDADFRNYWKRTLNQWAAFSTGAGQ